MLNCLSNLVKPLPYLAYDHLANISIFSHEGDNVEANEIKSLNAPHC